MDKPAAWAADQKLGMAALNTISQDSKVLKAVFKPGYKELFAILNGDAAPVQAAETSTTAARNQPGRQEGDGQPPVKKQKR